MISRLINAIRSRLSSSSSSQETSASDSQLFAECVARLDGIRGRVPGLIADGRYEEAISELRVFLQLGWWNEANVRFDPWADSMIHRIGQTLAMSNHESNPQRVTYITSGILAQGGLTQLLLNLMRHHDHDRFGFEIVNTDFFPKSDLDCERALELKGYSPLQTFHNESGYLHHAKAIVDYLRESKVGVLVFLLSPDDVTGLLVASAFPSIPKVFINASHHVFSGGSFQFDALVDIHPNYYQESKSSKRNPSLHYISLASRMDRATANGLPVRKLREELSLQEDAFLTITVGNVQKCLWNGSRDYVHLVGWMLDSFPEVHHLILAPNADILIDVFHEEYPNLSNRLHPLTPTQDIIQLLKGTDLYINSYPLGGALSSIDAMTSGIPVIFVQIDLDWFMLPNQTAMDAESYQEILHRMLSDEDFRRSKLDEQSRRFDELLSPNRMARSYEELYANINPVGRQSLDSDVSSVLELVAFRPQKMRHRMNRIRLPEEG